MDQLFALRVFVAARASKTSPRHPRIELYLTVGLTSDSCHQIWFATAAFFGER
ncbi:hypothetical protein [Cupriavidus sp. CP313]